jgi:hypothetical protein
LLVKEIVVDLEHILVVVILVAVVEVLVLLEKVKLEIKVLQEQVELAYHRL